MPARQTAALACLCLAIALLFSAEWSGKSYFQLESQNLATLVSEAINVAAYVACALLYTPFERLLTHERTQTALLLGAGTLASLGRTALELATSPVMANLGLVIHSLCEPVLLMACLFLLTRDHPHSAALVMPASFVVAGLAMTFKQATSLAAVGTAVSAGPLLAAALLLASAKLTASTAPLEAPALGELTAGYPPEPTGAVDADVQTPKRAGTGASSPARRATKQSDATVLCARLPLWLFVLMLAYDLEASHTPHVFPGETQAKANLMPEGNLDFSGDTCRIKANKGVILATGGSMGNLVIRTAYDPRLGPEFDGLGGMPYSNADGSGEIAGMEVGAILGNMVAYAQPYGGHAMSPAKRVGCRYVYSGGYNKTSVLWPYMVATGVIRDPESMIIVNALGARCGNEDVAWNGSDAFACDFFDTALSSVVIDDPDVDGDARRIAGPLWAIFDQACADRNDWDMAQGTVDYDNGYCFKADTLEELAAAVVNKYYEDIKMDADTLVATVQAYNDACDSGTDDEWGRTTLVNKIETGPFYAAWSTPALHDCYGGLRVAPNMQCVDIRGNLIEGLYACGESAGGTRTHGLSLAIPTGYIAGTSAAAGGQTGVAVSAPESWDEMTVYGGAPEEKREVTYDPAASLTDGTYDGTSSSGHDGPVAVSVTVEGGAIASVEVTKNSETPTIGGAALPTLCDEAVEAQSADVEAVAGATTTSRAFTEALKAALAKAQAA